MKTQISSKGAIEPAKLREWLARPVERLEKKLGRFPKDAVLLRVTVRRAGGERVETSLVLELPSATLAVSEEALDPYEALSEAFEELERRVEKEKTRLRRETAWARSKEAFQAELIERASAQASEAFSEVVAQRLRRDLDSAERFIRRELRSLEANGVLARGEIDPRDVVDTAFQRAIEKGVPTRRQLFKAASKALRAEVGRTLRGRREIHIEQDIPEVPPEREVSTLGSEIFDFYQPDEDLRMEDILASMALTPEEIEAGAERQKVIYDALTALPASWRQALHLSLAEGFDEAELADALECAPEEVGPILERVRAFLRERLIESGVLDAAGSETPD